MSANRILVEMLGGKCQLCYSTYSLQLHHKDNNRLNNVVANIMLVCKVCHDKMHGKRDATGVRFRVSVVQVGKSLKVTVPHEVCIHLSIQKGDHVYMWVNDLGEALFQKAE